MRNMCRYINDMLSKFRKTSGGNFRFIKITGIFGIFGLCLFSVSTLWDGNSQLMTQSQYEDTWNWLGIATYCHSLKSCNS